jgi:hypothetical protein
VRLATRRPSHVNTKSPRVFVRFCRVLRAISNHRNSYSWRFPVHLLQRIGSWHGLDASWLLSVGQEAGSAGMCRQHGASETKQRPVGRSKLRACTSADASTDAPTNAYPEFESLFSAYISIVIHVLHAHCRSLAPRPTPDVVVVLTLRPATRAPTPRPTPMTKPGKCFCRLYIQILR